MNVTRKMTGGNPLPKLDTSEEPDPISLHDHEKQVSLFAGSLVLTLVCHACPKNSHRHTNLKTR